MLELVVALFTMFVPDHVALGLQRTAPSYLTLETARDHIAAATVISAITGTEPEDLLGIAHHESRYKRDAVTAEPGGRWSCGVMTPEPMRDLAACLENTRSLAAGYFAGARHLRAWLDLRHSRWSALVGYGGTKAAREFVVRASWIRRAMAAPPIARVGT